MLRGSTLSVAGPVVLAAALLGVLAHAGPGMRDVPSVFHVAKSENRNQVHYGVHLDAACAPSGAMPAFAYWRMFEHGPLATEPLLDREVGAYGFADQRVTERGPDGGRIALRLRALPSRPIMVWTGHRDDSCEATATTWIGGAPAVLESVFVQLRWPFGVARLVLSGRRLADGRPLQETLSE